MITVIKKLTLFTGMIALVIAISGCTATATVGKRANPPWVGLDNNDGKGVSVRVPFVRVGLGHEE